MDAAGREKDRQGYRKAPISTMIGAPSSQFLHVQPGTALTA